MYGFLKWFIRTSLIVAGSFAAGKLYGGEPLRIDGPKVVEAGKLVVLTPQGDVGGAALLWEVSPEDKADVLEMADGRLVLTGPEGAYKVRLRSVRLKDGRTTAETARHSFTIGKAPEGQKRPDKPVSMVPQCIGKLRVGNSGCTATPIWPRRADGRWDVLTASHCTDGVGTKGLLTLKDGREFTLTVAQRSTASDLTWFVTDAVVEDMPYGVLASSDPEPGTAIWQAGYGTDRPTIRKDGTVIGSSGNGQLSFRLSVSHGDSGGPIFRSDSGEVVAAVCCTEKIAALATMYGGSCSTAGRLRPGSTAMPLSVDADAEHSGCVLPFLRETQPLPSAPLMRKAS